MIYWKFLDLEEKMNSTCVTFNVIWPNISQLFQNFNRRVYFKTLTRGVVQHQQQHINIISLYFLGRGVFATEYFSKGSYLLEYKGELLTEEEGVKREQEYNESLGSFIFFFKSGAKTMW